MPAVLPQGLSGSLILGDVGCGGHTGSLLKARLHSTAGSGRLKFTWLLPTRLALMARIVRVPR